MKNYVFAVKTGKMNGLDEMERNIIGLEIKRLDQDIDWESIEKVNMDEVKRELKEYFPKGWTSLYFSALLSLKVFKNHREKTYREFYESLNEKEIEYMNASLEQGIEGAMRIAG